MIIDDFRRRFEMFTAHWDWQVEGFVDKSGYVYLIDTDSKVISTVFERLSSPVIRSIAKENGYVVQTANQTTYPDFTLTNAKTAHRIAIDVKTTYAQNRMNFTLGGYNSFLRNNTKNILYPYNSYAEHWIAGFVYKQQPAFDEYDLDKMPKVGEIGCPYTVEVAFLRQKHEIAGLRAGSGNTKNIGSVTVTKAEEFKTVAGPFLGFELSRDACDYYWKDYERLCANISNAAQLTSHKEFQKFNPQKLLLNI